MHAAGASLWELVRPSSQPVGSRHQASSAELPRPTDGPWLAFLSGGFHGSQSFII